MSSNDRNEASDRNDSDRNDSNNGNDGKNGEEKRDSINVEKPPLGDPSSPPNPQVKEAAGRSGGKGSATAPGSATGLGGHAGSNRTSDLAGAPGVTGTTAIPAATATPATRTPPPDTAAAGANLDSSTANMDQQAGMEQRESPDRPADDGLAYLSQGVDTENDTLSHRLGDFVRERPGVVLAAVAIAGFLLARTLRASTRRHAFHQQEPGENRYGSPASALADAPERAMPPPPLGGGFDPDWS